MKPSARAYTTHVVMIDGTFSSLMQGRRTNIGRIYRLLRQQRGLEGRLRLHYSAGQQWENWRSLAGVAMGSGMAGRITDAYRWLAAAYQPGDRIFLLGYSRGGFAVRSLAGMIGRIGLLTPNAVNARNTRLAWRFYREGGTDQARQLFRSRRCHAQVPIRMIGVFDTVMALGIRLPALWMLTEPHFRFHDQHLGPLVEHAAQALALDETRSAFQPILWTDQGHAGSVRQMWFRGAHADIGGQLEGFEPARPLANIPLRWMLEECAEAGLPLPDGWPNGLAQNAGAPSVGSWRNWGKLFLARAPRIAGHDHSEALHHSVPVPYHGPAVLTGHLAGAEGGDNGADANRQIARNTI